MSPLSRLLHETDPQRYFWSGSAAAHGSPLGFMTELPVQMEELKAGSGSADVVFAMGRALKSKERRLGKQRILIFMALLKPCIFSTSVAIISKSGGHLDCRWIEEQSCQRHSKDDW
jgi:hypothetical protein